MCITPGELVKSQSFMSVSLGVKRIFTAAEAKGVEMPF